MLLYSVYVNSVSDRSANGNIGRRRTAMLDINQGVFSGMHTSMSPAVTASVDRVNDVQLRMSKR